jgi:hypothetical protein
MKIISDATREGTQVILLLVLTAFIICMYGFTQFFVWFKFLFKFFLNYLFQLTRTIHMCKIKYDYKLVVCFTCKSIYIDCSY